MHQPLAGSALRGQTEENDYLLLWMPYGSADVRIGDAYYSVRQGGAMWIPPGTEHDVTTLSESVPVPLTLPREHVPGDLERPFQLEIPEDWRNWLFQRLMLEMGYCHHAAAHQLESGDGLTGTDARPELLAVTDELPTPRSPVVSFVLDSFRRNPRDGATVSQWAARGGVSMRTLQRQVQADTGLTFDQWKSSLRMSMAAGLLARGVSVRESAREIGFCSVSSFSRTFHRHFGMRPGSYRSMHDDGRTRSSHAAVPVADTAVARLVRARVAGERLKAPGLAAAMHPQHVNDSHVVVWNYRGSSQITLAGHEWHVHEGDSMLLPAGLPIRIRTSPDAIQVPLGMGFSPQHIAMEDLTVQHHSEAEAKTLLGQQSANYTLLHPRGHDFGEVVKDFEQQIEAARERRLQLPMTAVARRVVRILNKNPGDFRDLADWAVYFRVDEKALREAFMVETGRQFNTWRAELRMRVARVMLRTDAPIKAVSRGLGYSHPAGFTKVFRDKHGVPPSEYRRASV